MRKLLLVMCLLLVGCDWYSMGRPKLQQGEATETQKVKQRNELNTEILVDSKGTDKPGPVTVYDFYDHKVRLPSTANVQFKVKNDYDSTQTDWYKLVGTFNYKSGMGQLIFIGAICIAAGAVLCYFGMWSIGVGLIIFGVLLLACGVTIERYPWIFPCVLLLGLIGVVAFVVYTIRHKNAVTTADTQETVLKEIVSKIEDLKKVNPELVKQYITDALQKSDISATIKKVVSGVKNA
jgi:hypothetical protein